VVWTPCLLRRNGAVEHLPHWYPIERCPAYDLFLQPLGLSRLRCGVDRAHRDCFGRFSRALTMTLRPQSSTAGKCRRSGNRKREGANATRLGLPHTDHRMAAPPPPPRARSIDRYSAVARLHSRGDGPLTYYVLLRREPEHLLVGLAEVRQDLAMDKPRKMPTMRPAAPAPIVAQVPAWPAAVVAAWPA